MRLRLPGERPQVAGVRVTDVIKEPQKSPRGTVVGRNLPVGTGYIQILGTTLIETTGTECATRHGKDVGKPVDERIQGVLTMVGVLCLLTLMVFVLGNDIYRLFS